MPVMSHHENYKNRSYTLQRSFDLKNPMLNAVPFQAPTEAHKLNKSGDTINQGASNG